MEKKKHSTYGNFEFFAIGNNHDSPDAFGTRIGDEHSVIGLFELRRDGSKLRFDSLKACVLLGPEDKEKKGYHHYFSYFIGVAQKYNNVIACGFTGESIQNYDLFTTYMTNEWFDEPTEWNYSELRNRIHTDYSVRELNESRPFLPQYFASDIGIYPRRGLASGLFVEGTGAIVVGTEDEEETKKQIRVMFNPEPYEYGSSAGENSNEEWISRIQIGNINNSSGSSGSSGYSDFTDVSTNFQLGYLNSVELEPGFSSHAYHEYWKIWIDFDGDGYFNDEEETIFSGHSIYPVYGFAGIPSDAKPGPTRMRVSMKYGSYPSPYETFTWGEVEDYTVYIDKPCCGST